MFTVMQKDKEGNEFYLNHSCMGTLSFGSEDMAWTTLDMDYAELMADKCRNVHKPDKSNSEIFAVELY